MIIVIYERNNYINEDIYVRCDLGEVTPKVQFEIERADYTKVTFDLLSSGRTSEIIADNLSYKNYHFKMTFKSFLYYLCI